jgi:hypothetical protein
MSSEARDRLHIETPMSEETRPMTGAEPDRSRWDARYVLCSGMLGEAR